MSMDFKLNTPRRLASSIFSQVRSNAVLLKLRALHSGRRGGWIYGTNHIICLCGKEEHRREEESCA